MSKQATPVLNKEDEAEFNNEEKRLAKLDKDELEQIADDDEEDVNYLKEVSNQLFNQL